MIQGYADHAANERTFLAWVRTGVAVIAFGFGSRLTIVGFARANIDHTFRALVQVARAFRSHHLSFQAAMLRFSALAASASASRLVAKDTSDRSPACPE